MLPKKIYLNGGDENAVTICSREPITRSYGNTHSREYTDLSQVWHPASEESQERFSGIIFRVDIVPPLVCAIRGGMSLREVLDARFGLRNWESIKGLCKWAYIDDLLPK